MQKWLTEGPFLYYVRVKGWMGGIAKYLLFFTGMEGGGGFHHPYPYVRNKTCCVKLTCNHSLSQLPLKKMTVILDEK